MPGALKRGSEWSHFAGEDTLIIPKLLSFLTVVGGENDGAEREKKRGEKGKDEKKGVEGRGGKGKGNLEWNNSAPHGSGRRIQRSEVKQHYTVSAFKNEMKGIYCSCIGADTLDETPFAYRDMEKLLGDIKDSVEVTDILKPVYNFKAGGKM